jgi:hypothetical protein
LSVRSTVEAEGQAKRAELEAERWRLQEIIARIRFNQQEP